MNENVELLMEATCCSSFLPPKQLGTRLLRRASLQTDTESKVILNLKMSRLFMRKITQQGNALSDLSSFFSPDSRPRHVFILSFEFSLFLYIF